MSAAGTAERVQMDFTRREFWRGAWASWGIFMISLTIALTVAGLLQADASAVGLAMIFLIYGLPIGAVVSLLAMLIGSPIAWVIGRLLRRAESITAHVTSYAALGGFIGAAVLAIAPLGDPRESLAAKASLALVVIAVCAVSVAGGWAWTFIRSRAERSS